MRERSGRDKWEMKEDIRELAPYKDGTDIFSLHP